MSPLTLKISLDNGTIFKKVKFNSKDQIYDALKIIEDKIFDGAGGEGFGLFLTSADDQRSGIWLEPEKTLEYYMLRDGDIVHYMNRIRTLRLRMLDGSVKTLKVDDSFAVNTLMLQICSKIGITNHDEYSLCREVKHVDVPEDAKIIGSSDTLSKRKTPHGQVLTTLERDSKMEQLRKKLKTDDDVLWVDLTKTLREQSIDSSETLLLKRRLFFSDRNVDSRDPVQLNLLYVQARDAILDGTHPVTQDQAIQFAGIQCQVQFGDHDQTKHTCELIDSSLKDFLPEHYIRVRGIEKSILKEHRKHVELSELDAKMLYNRNARSLTTYGVTFFLVKEKQKGKNKLVPRLLGINAESIIRVDEKTRDILEIWPLSHVKKWAPTTTTFTLDFGEYSKQLYTVQTTEAPRIIEVLTGYIDIILKKKHGIDYRTIQLEKYEEIHQETVQPHNASIIQQITVEGQPKKLNIETFTSAFQLAPNDCGQDQEFITVPQENTSTQMMYASNSSIMRAAAKVLEISDEMANKIKIRPKTVPKLLNSINMSTLKLSVICEEKENLNAEDLEGETKYINNCVKDLAEGIVNKTKDMDDKAKKILMHQFDIISSQSKELNTLVNAKGPYNISEMQSTTAKLSDASMKLYFLMDPETNRRSQLLLASRKSFIKEDKATDKRLSKVLNQGISDICDAIDAAEKDLDKDDNQPILSNEHLLHLKKRAANQLAQADAAAAALLAAHVDPKDVDYSAAVMSVNTISDLVPNIIGDIKLITRVMPEKKRKLVLKNLQNHCEIVKELCSSPKTHNIDKIHEGAQKFVLASERLFLDIGVDGNPNLAHEIIRLAKAVGDKSSKLLIATNEAAEVAHDETSKAIKRASKDVSHLSRRLITCAKLTAPSIFEPHCQSAMLSATEGISSSITILENSWKPMIDESNNQDLASDLAYHTAEVEHAIDCLKDACKPPTTQFAFNIKDLNYEEEAMEVDKDNEIGSYLKEVANDAVQNLLASEDKLFDTKDSAEILNGEDAALVRREIEDWLSVINAAAGDLVMGHTDSTLNNKMPIIVSINTMVSTLPLIVKGVRSVTTKCDDNLRTLFLSTKELCLADPENVNDAASKFGDSSSKVLDSISLSCNPDNEKQTINSSKEIGLKVSDLLNEANGCVNNIQDEKLKDKIEQAGFICADTAQRFMTCAKITSPTLSKPCCRISFIEAIKEVKNSIRNLAVILPEVQNLPNILKDIENNLNNLQSENSKNAARSLLVANEKKKVNNNSYKPRKDIDELVKRLTEIARSLELAEQKAKDQPKDLLAQKELDDALNELQDILKVMQRTNDDENKMVPEIAVDSDIANKLSNISKTLVNENNPIILIKLTKDLLQDVQTLKYQKSPRTQKNLEDLAKRLAAAARELELTEQKVKNNPNDTSLENDLKNAIKNIQQIGEELQSSFHNIPQNDRELVVLNKNNLRTRHNNDLFKSGAENIIQQTKPAIVLEITKNILANLENESLKLMSNEDRKKMKYLAERLAQAARALEDVVFKAKVNPDDNKIQNELLNAVKNIHVIANEINGDTSMSNEAIPSSSLHCNLPDINLLKSTTTRIVNQTDPKKVAHEAEILQNYLEGLSKIQTSEQTRRKLKYFSHKLADAAEALKVAEMKSKDNPRDKILQEDVQNIVTNVQSIISEIYNDIPLSSEEIKILDPHNNYCNNSLRYENILNYTETPIIKMSSDSANLITLSAENVLLAKQANNLRHLTRLFIVDLQNVWKSESLPETRIYIEKCISDLTEATEIVERTEKLLNDKPNDLNFQKEHHNACISIHNIVSKIHREVSDICDEDNRRGLKLIKIPPPNAQTLIAFAEAVLKDRKPENVMDHAHGLYNNIQGIDKTEITAEVHKNLDYYLKKISTAIQALEIVHTKLQAESKDEILKIELEKSIDYIQKISQDLYNDITKSNAYINYKSLKITPKLRQVLKSSTNAIKLSTEPKKVEEHAITLINDIHNILKEEKSPEARRNLQYFAQKLAEAAASLEIAEQNAKTNLLDKTVKMEIKTAVQHVYEIADELLNSLELATSQNAKINTNRPSIPIKKWITERQILSNVSMDLINSEKDWSARYDQPIRFDTLNNKMKPGSQLESASHEICITLVNAEDLFTNLNAVLVDESPIRVKRYAKTLKECIQKQAAIQKTKEAQEILNNYVIKFENSLKVNKHVQNDNKAELETEKENNNMHSIKEVAIEFHDNIVSMMKLNTEIKSYDHEMEIKKFIDSLNIDDQQYNINQFVDTFIKEIRDFKQHHNLPEKRLKFDEYANELDAARNAFILAQKDASKNKDVHSKENLLKASQKLINILHLIQNNLLLSKRDNVERSPIEIIITLIDAEALINNVNTAVEFEDISLINSIINEIRTQAMKQDTKLAKDYLNDIAQKLLDAEYARNNISLDVKKDNQALKQKVINIVKEFQNNIVTPLKKLNDNQLEQSELQQTVNSLMTTKDIPEALTNADILIRNLKQMESLPENSNHRCNLANYSQILKSASESLKLAEHQAKANPKDQKCQFALKEAKVVLLKIANQCISDIEPVKVHTDDQRILTELETILIKRRVIDDISRINTSVIKLLSEQNNMTWSYETPNADSKVLSLLHLQPNVSNDDNVYNKNTLNSITKDLSELYPRIYKDVAVLSELQMPKLNKDSIKKVTLIKNCVANICRSVELNLEFQDVFHNFVLLEDAASNLINDLDCVDDADKVIKLKSNAKEMLNSSMFVVENSISLSEKIPDTQLAMQLYDESKQYEQFAIKHCLNTLILSPVMGSVESKKVMASSISDIEENITKLKGNANKLCNEDKYSPNIELILEQLENSEKLIKDTKDITNNDVYAQSLYLLEMVEDFVTNETEMKEGDTQKIIQNVELLSAIIDNKRQTKYFSSSNYTDQYLEQLKDLSAKINILEADVKAFPKNELKKKQLKDSIKLLHHLLLVVVLKREMYNTVDVATVVENLTSENQVLTSYIEDVIKATKGTADEKATEKLNIIIQRNNKLNTSFKVVNSELDYADNAYEYIQQYKLSKKELFVAEDLAEDKRRIKDLLLLPDRKIQSICNNIISVVAKIREKYNYISINNALDCIDKLEQYVNALTKDNKDGEDIAKGNEIYKFYANEAKRGICQQVYNLIDNPNVNKICLKIISYLCIYIHNMHLQIKVSDPDNKLSLINSLERTIFSIKIVLVEVFNYYIYGTSGKLPLSYAKNITNQFIKEIHLENDTDIVKSYQEILNLNLFRNNDVLSNNMTILQIKEQVLVKVYELNRLVSTISNCDEHHKTHTKITEAFIQLSALLIQFSELSGENEEKININTALKNVTTSVFIVLWTSHFVNNNQNNIASRRSLTQSCLEFNDSLNELVKVTHATDSLQQHHEDMLRNTHMLHVVLHDKLSPTSGDGYADSIDVMKAMQIEYEKFKIEDINDDNYGKMLNNEFVAMSKCVDCANQCAYLLSISETDPSIAQNGFIDTYTLMRLANQVQASCISLQYTATERDLEEICSDTIELTSVLCEASIHVCDIIKTRNISEGRQDWSKEVGELAQTASKFAVVLHADKLNKTEILLASSCLNKAVSNLAVLVNQTTFFPYLRDPSPHVAKNCEIIADSTRDLITKYMIFVDYLRTKAIAPNTVRTINQRIASARSDFICTFNTLLNNLRSCGEKMALISGEKEIEDANGYLDKQINLIKRWLQKPKMAKFMTPGQEAVQSIISVAETITKELQDETNDGLAQVTQDTKLLLEECSTKPDEDKCRNLLDKTLELKRIVEKSVVNRVVESLNDETEVQDMKYIVLYETDDSIKTTSLEEKISALLNHLSQITTTVRVVVATSGGGKVHCQTLLEDTLKAELLAPKLVQAAKLSVGSPTDMALKEVFNVTYDEYYDTVSRVRDTCDKSVDPLDFVRSAGEIMHKLCEKTKSSKDSQETFKMNAKITRLANRVMLVGVSESTKTSDPELEKALEAAQQRLRAAIPSSEVRISRVPDWSVTSSEILRGASEVESALGGENIFKQDLNPDQPIFMAAHALHTCVRQWSARDNDIVEAARKAAVLMAKLSTYMARDKKDASIRTSREIVVASSEVTRLARKLSLECTDLRIRKNLQQVSEQIPTISGQLKMLSSVKATKNTQNNTNVAEDMEAMAMLVNNAQNLMLSVEQVVKAAAAASVKIESEKGSGRLQWRTRRY